MKTITGRDRCLRLLSVLAVSACGGDAPAGGDAESAPSSAEQPAPATTTASGSGYLVVEVADGGTIRGTVRYTGSVPASRTVAVSDDVEACGTSINVSTVQVGSNQGLRNVVVSLTDITEGAAISVSSTPPALDQDGCEFTPHILIAPVQETVNVLNSDPITHNVHTAAFENRPLNRAQPAAVRSIDVTFDAAEKVRVRCDIHEWMSAWIVVVDHPYYQVTGESGSFVLENVPPGTYTMEVWHEQLGATTQQVTVTAGSASEVNVELTSSGQ